MNFLKDYLKYRKKTLLVHLMMTSIFIFTFYLYHLPVKAVLYPAALCVIIAAAFLIYDYRRMKKCCKELEMIKQAGIELCDNLPVPTSMTDEEYQKMIREFCFEHALAAQKYRESFDDMINYYTLWAHQIKTPIASMRLSLQNEDSIFSRKLQNDLNRIEQYVSMVLTYLRLGSDSTDYMFKEYDLDSIVRSAVKKFAGEFIGKKLTLDYAELNTPVLTDEKWLSFVVEQVLSNALKYTPSGSISIYMEKPKTLCIKDTGIGIAPEDLPRIFENGYTGFNGRSDKRASGIGLYLCKRICDNLGHKLSVESVVGKGTIMRIDLNCIKRVHE